MMGKMFHSRATSIKRSGLSHIMLFGGLALLALFWACHAQAAPLSSSDPCLSFLSYGFTDGSASQETRPPQAGNVAAAGKAATISLLFGVRLALGPAEDLNGRQNMQEPASGISAPDIQRYRDCKKEQALRVSYLP